MSPKMHCLLVLAIISSAACLDLSLTRSLTPHVDPAGGRIIGGSEAPPNSYPFMAALRINGNAFCGGFLISPDWILTAAHCGVVIRTVDVILGAHNITDDFETTRQTIQGAEVINHESYNRSSFLNDIALVRLNQTAVLNQFVQVANLPNATDRNNTYDGYTVRALGWGLEFDVPNPSTGDISPVLRYVDVGIVSVLECGNFYNEPGYDYVTDTNVCTSGYKNRGTCNGDSGGPLLYENVTVGITSFGTDLCEVCSPSVYTRIVEYVDWIALQTGIIL